MLCDSPLVPRFFFHMIPFDVKNQAFLYFELLVTHVAIKYVLVVVDPIDMPLNVCFVFPDILAAFIFTRIFFFTMYCSDMLVQIVFGIKCFTTIFTFVIK